MVRVVSTYKDKRLAELPELDFIEGKSDGGDSILVNTEERYQKVLGFGAALTDSACYLISELKDGKREEILKEFFSPDAMNLSVCRISVGSSDYARVRYSYDDTPDDFDLRDFSIDYDRQYIIPVLKEARGENPELYLFSSTWSPPGWMKTGGSMYGGWLRAKYLEVYARYYTRFLKEYQKAGVEINAFTLQNETETDQQSRMPASYMHPEYEAAILKDYMKPLLKSNDLNTKIWIMDHNYIMWKRAKWMLDDPELKKITNGVAFHPYEGTPDMMSMFHEAHPEISLYWTEGGPSLSPNYAVEWTRWGKAYAEILNNWCESITAWNLALDEQGNPNIGPFKCAGMITVNSKTKEISYSGQYWAMGHFSKYIKRGAVRVSSSCTAEGIYQTAFVNPDGEKVLVVTNTGEEKELQILCGEKIVKFSCPGDSISTIMW